MISATEYPTLTSADKTLFNNVTNYTTTTNALSPLTSALFVPCNNPRNVVSSFVAEMVDLVMYAGIFPVLVTCGIITNVINMVVFARQKLSDRIHLCLFSLAVTDTGFLLFLMCGKSYALVSLVDSSAGSFWQQRNYGTVLGPHLGFLIISNVVTALLAAERCLCVLSPLKAAKFFRTKSMGVLIVVVGVYTLVVKTAALSLKYQTVEVKDPATNASTFISRLSPFYLRHRTIIEIIYIDHISIVTPILSLAVVILCTAVTAFRLKVASAWRLQSASNMTSAERRETAVTRMLVTVCCVYVICMTPAMTRIIALQHLPGFMIAGHLCNVYKVCTAVSRLMEAVNSSVNFLIYMKQSSRYRATFWQLCGCVSDIKTKEGKSQNLSVSASHNRSQKTRQTNAKSGKRVESCHM